MRTLVFNIGSASVRWALFDKNLNRVAGENIEYPDFSNLEKLTTDILNNLNLKGSDVIGHRVVHGGPDFAKPTKITEKSISKLESLNSLAPLHNPPALRVIKTCGQVAPEIPNIVCFDTSFFVNLPDYAKFYALPWKIIEKYKIIRYGFHGISHEYSAKEAAKKLGRPLNKLKLITCHLGSGASITATENGAPIDTSMGFTPLEGLMMATRCGSIDPAIPLFLSQQEDQSAESVQQLLNQSSGLSGISGIGGDMREIIAATQSKDINPERRNRAGLALKMYAYQIKKYIGAYTVALGGIDALVFSGAVAERSELVRGMITHGLKELLGNFETIIIPTNEELAIARKVSHSLA